MARTVNQDFADLLKAQTAIKFSAMTNVPVSFETCLELSKDMMDAITHLQRTLAVAISTLERGAD